MWRNSWFNPPAAPKENYKAKIKLFKRNGERWGYREHPVVANMVVPGAKWSDSWGRKAVYGCSVSISKATGNKNWKKTDTLASGSHLLLKLPWKHCLPALQAPPHSCTCPCSQLPCTRMPEKSGCSRPSCHTVTVFHSWCTRGRILKDRHPECHREHGESGALPSCLPFFLPLSFLLPPPSFSFMVLM